MAASYPTSTKSFSVKNPLQTIASAHIDDIQDEIVAIETDLIARLPSGQVVFPATQVPSAAANTLDDYEEGSWTPVLGGSGGTSGQTYGTQAGRYIKIGRLVWATYDLTLTAKGTITGSVELQGLPFTSDTGVTGTIATVYFVGLATNWINVVTHLPVSATAAAVQGNAAAGANINTSLVAADIANTTTVRGTIIYRASA